VNASRSQAAMAGIACLFFVETGAADSNTILIQGLTSSSSQEDKLRQSLKVYTMMLALWALTVKAQENSR